MANNGNTSPKREAYTTSLDPDLIRKFKVHCAVINRRQNEVLEEIIKNLLEKEGDRKNGVSN